MGESPFALMVLLSVVLDLWQRGRSGEAQIGSAFAMACQRARSTCSSPVA